MTHEPRPHTCFDYERVGAIVGAGIVVAAVVVTIVIKVGLVAVAVGVVGLVAAWVCFNAFRPDPVRPRQEPPSPATEEQRYETGAREVFGG